MGEGEPNYHLIFRICLAEYNEIIFYEFSSGISDLNDTSVAIRYCLCCLNGIIFGHYWVNLDIRRSTVKLKLRYWVLFARCNYDKPLPPSLSPVWCDRGVAGMGIWHPELPHTNLASSPTLQQAPAWDWT